MKTGRYSLKDLLTHNEIEQIIIPEIQRDYVWGKDNVTQLLGSIYKSFSEKNNEKLKLYIQNQPIAEKSVNEYLQKEYEKLKYNFKIGFIYAYHDNEYAGKFFLIDGQQRITTLYLLLFALYNKIEKREEFNEFYFKNNNLKLDYKVREASHDFLQDFISFSGKNIENSPRFYKKEYEKDTTIINLLRNYNEISEFIFDKNLGAEFIDYVENFIEFNYFDTNISEQGEQLYLYMNSRGEHLSYQEKIRAELIKKEANSIDKKKAGGLWEDWQNYFWVNRLETETNDTNADIGFEEFLKWATIIHIFQQKAPKITRFVVNEKKQSILEAKENYIHRVPTRLSEQNKLLQEYQISELNSPFLENIFEATKGLFNCNSDYIPINKSWLHNGSDLSTINYVYLIPLIYYIAENKNNNITITKRDIERLAMFLKNITHFTVNSKNPDRTVVIAMDLVKILTDDNKLDITYFLNQKFKKKYKSVLTDFEVQKLEELNKLNKDRPDLEEFLWKVCNDNDFSEFIEGNISFVFEYINEQLNYNSKSDTYDKTIVNRLYKLYNIFRDVFFDFKNDDLLRRALLTFGNYSIDDRGGSGHIDGWKHRFSFCIDLKKDQKEWEGLLNNKDHRNKRKGAFKFIKNIEEKYTLNFSYKEFFNKCIENYTDNDWKEPFIKYDGLLHYSEKKRFLWNNDEHNIVLLNKLKANNAVYIQIILTTILVNKLQLIIGYHNSCYADFYFDKKTEKLITEENGENYRLIIEYQPTNKLFIYYLASNIDEKSRVFKPFENSIWVKEDEHLVINDKQFTKYDNAISIIENIDNVKKNIEKIIKQTEEILKTD